jgi:hypothetical protein
LLVILMTGREWTNRTRRMQKSNQKLARTS